MKTEEYKELKSPERNQTEEIDLYKLFLNISNFLSNLLKKFIRFLFLIGDTIINNLKFLSIITVAGSLLGLGYFFAVKPYYASSMTLSSDYYKGEFLNNTIHNLNEICEEKNTRVLANLLHIPVTKAQQIKSVKVNPILSQNYQMLIDFYSSDDKYRNRLDSLLLASNESFFQLGVEVYDTAALRGLDTVLVNYIRNNEYVKKRIAVDRANLVNLREKLSRESVNLDTLKRSIALSVRKQSDAGRNGANNVIMGERSADPITIYREDLRIYNERQNIERQLALKSEIEIIEKFIPYTEPESGTLLKNMIKGAIIGLALGFAYILYKLLRSGLTQLRYNIEEQY